MSNAKRAANLGTAILGLAGLLAGTYITSTPQEQNTLLKRVGRDKFVNSETERIYGDMHVKNRDINIYRKTSGLFETPSYERNWDYTIMDLGADGQADVILIPEIDPRFGKFVGRFTTLDRERDYETHSEEFDGADQILQNYEKICVDGVRK